MKNVVRLAVALCALALAVPAAAQQQARKQFGLGVAINPSSDMSPTLGEIYVPIRLAPNFRLEPSIGIFSNDPDGPTNNSRDFILGLGAFYTASAAPALDWYAGARLKLNFAKQETPAGDVSDTDMVFAGAFGGEYFFVPSFSLGLEGQLGLYQRGDVNGNDSGWFTTGLAFLRFYF